LVRPAQCSPLNDHAADQRHRARLQDQQTVMPCPRFSATCTASVWLVLSGETAADKQSVDY
jgi:hypothetical protein